MPLPAGCELRTFRDLGALVSEYVHLAAWIGTDTGLYHLAAVIGIRATVFFGPTQRTRSSCRHKRMCKYFAWPFGG